MNAAELTLRLSTLIPNPTCATETLWGPKLAADSCTEADTQAAWEAWQVVHTGRSTNALRTGELR